MRDKQRKGKWPFLSVVLSEEQTIGAANIRIISAGIPRFLYVISIMSNMSDITSKFRYLSYGFNYCVSRFIRLHK